MDGNGASCESQVVATWGMVLTQGIAAICELRRIFLVGAHLISEGLDFLQISIRNLCDRARLKHESQQKQVLKLS